MSVVAFVNVKICSTLVPLVYKGFDISIVALENSCLPAIYSFMVSSWLALNGTIFQGLVVLLICW